MSTLKLVLVSNTYLIISRKSVLALIKPGSLYSVLLRAVALLQRSAASVAVFAALSLSVDMSPDQLFAPHPLLPVSSHCPITPGLTSSQPSSTDEGIALLLSAEADLLAFLTNDHLDFDCGG